MRGQCGWSGTQLNTDLLATEQLLRCFPLYGNEWNPKLGTHLIYVGEVIIVGSSQNGTPLRATIQSGTHK